MPDSLGSIFPESARKQYADDNIKQGSVIRAFFSRFNKIKFFVIVSKCIWQEKELALVVINSEINPFWKRDANLEALHLPITNSEYDFLTGDSFVDCTEIFPMQEVEVRKILSEEPECHKGFLSEELFATVLHTLRGSKTIKGDTKKRYGLFVP